MLPPANVLLVATVMLLVVEVPVIPEGNVHWYEVAPTTASVVNTKLCERQTTDGPLTLVGVPNGPKSTMPSQLSSKPLQVSVAPG